MKADRGIDTGVPMPSRQSRAMRDAMCARWMEKEMHTLDTLVLQVLHATADTEGLEQ